jgi:hypothetical protein
MGPATVATFIVETASGSGALSDCNSAPGDCSLCGALDRANLDATDDTVAFNVPTRPTAR